MAGAGDETSKQTVEQQMPAQSRKAADVFLNKPIQTRNERGPSRGRRDDCGCGGSAREWGNVCAFPPFRQEEVERMGHGFLVGLARCRRGLAAAAARVLRAVAMGAVPAA